MFLNDFNCCHGLVGVLPKSMNNHTDRSVIANALKAIGAQLIVLHHLAFYGPMSDTAHELAPGLIDWLANHARIAVQVFLVVGGFLAARSLPAGGHVPIMQSLVLVWQRYCRLVIPFMAAMALAIACAAFARALLPLASTPAASSLPQLIAHLLLVQNLLGYDALSAGVWYVAIDFQLYALLVALLWLSGHVGAGNHRALAVVLVSGLAVASLFHFNRMQAWDDWALYFFGAYALGVLAYWATEQEQATAWLSALAALTIAALAFDFRSRIAVALLVALLLAAGRLMPAFSQRLDLRPLAFLGNISYALFLVHYPVCLVVNAVLGRLAPGNPLAHASGLLFAWAASLGAGILFHRHVERRFATRRPRRPGLCLQMARPPQDNGVPCPRPLP